MKIRVGFVSNSSSSSFYGFFGRITNPEKFSQFCRDKGIKEKNLNKIKGIELATAHEWEIYQDRLADFFDPLDGDDLYHFLPTPQILCSEVLEDCNRDPAIADQWYILQTEFCSEWDKWFGEIDEPPLGEIFSHEFLSLAQSDEENSGLKILHIRHYSGHM